MMIFSKDFWDIALERMVKTIAQVMIATITASTFIPTLGAAWVTVATTSSLAGLISILTSLTAYSATSKSVNSPVASDVKLALEVGTRRQGPVTK